jgi:hypothetical protein
MPHWSEREQFIYGFHLEIQKEILKSFAVPLLCSDTSDEESDEEEEENFDVMSKAFVYYALKNSHYIFCPLTYRPDIKGTRFMGNTPRWKQILRGEIYNDAEFLKIFRVPLPMFLAFARILKDCPPFQSHDLKQHKHFSPKLHLLVTMKYFDSKGNACSAINVKDALGIGKGSVLNYVDHAVAAILLLENKSIFWPDAAKRHEISTQIKDQYPFPKVVGTVDGTHLVLSMKPSLHGEDYFTQKSRYAVVAMVVQDDKCLI